jgi:imidazolonepropionase-like amidohydrolase
MKKNLILFIVCLLSSFWSFGQETFPTNDVQDKRLGAYAFTHATLVVDSKTRLDDATLLIKNGRIEQLGQNITIPKNYVVIDAKDKFIYPSFIDMYTSYGLPKLEKGKGFGWGKKEVIMPEKKGVYNANDAIKSYYKAVEEFNTDKKTAKKFRAMGFGTVLSYRKDGIARGSSLVATLQDSRSNNVVLKGKSAAHYSFKRGNSSQMYPYSKMGQISLLRQTYLDAQWYKNQKQAIFYDQALESWNELQTVPQIFEVSGWQNLLRADNIGDEFGVQYIFKSTGDSYQRIKEIKNANVSLIVGLNFPKAYQVNDVFDAEAVTLKDLKHWELAPHNLAILAKNNITFSITSDGLDGKTFAKNLQKAIENGLDKNLALAALTSIPARLLGVQDEIGSLKKGMLANFLICSGEIFDKKTKIQENWVQGQKYNINKDEKEKPTGKYDLTVGTQKYNLEITEKGAKVLTDKDTLDAKIKFSDDDLVTMNFATGKESKKTIRLSGWVAATDFKGQGKDSEGNSFEWNAKFKEALEQKEKKDKDKEKKEGAKSELGKVTFPFVAYGAEELFKTELILIKNTTVWTNEKEGIIKDTDVLLKNGKISQIGKNLTASNAKVIDGKGKHLTAGIIDEHSHIALSSVNEVLSISSMVRMNDVIDSEDVNIYRQLAGGVTAAQLLHGSANPVGGQAAHIKLRWGSSPEEMKIKGSDGFIKFALGENVKNSRNQNSIRYPQTRMGVEQVYMDGFSRAKAYEKAWNTFNGLSSTQKSQTNAPRKDLALDALLEIINKKRFITCHSYVQSEINMLMKVADKFDFNVNTFTHILEGYKVADKMKEHGVGASTFSDWWAYKFEVRYAIPYNASLMASQGVVVAINSDDPEMARRLNQEAAKSVKYGGMSEEEAWKMVTLNPAKLLHLDDRMGSIKVGKDADVVLWSDNPLSIYAKAEKTIIDGKIYFDLEKDKILYQETQKERARIIAKMKKSPNAGKKKPSKMPRKKWHCDDLTGYEYMLGH